MFRCFLGLALQAVGTILFAISVGVLAGTMLYPESAAWRSQLGQPIVEARPEHLAGAITPDPMIRPAGVASSSWISSSPRAPQATGDTSAASGSDSEPLLSQPFMPSSTALAEDAATQTGSRRSDLASRPLPSYGRTVRIEIPRIGVDSTVTEVGIENGEYQVPSREVGHHLDSSSAGEPGNSVFNGHLQTLNAGRVFARLHELQAGDRIYLHTVSHQLDWVVQDVQTVPVANSSFILPTEDTRITLYTCAGSYNPLTRLYSHKLVVVAKMMAARARDLSAPLVNSPAPLPSAPGEVLPVSASSPPLPYPTAALRTIVDERFGNNDTNWPNDPRSTAWVADGAYRMFAREPSHFVAIGVPLAQALSDMVVRATFRKAGGPPGGGYGLIVRDQGPGPRDGISQSGRYYVLEAGDRGEFGIWRREGDHWVELIPWTSSTAIRSGSAPNELTVQAIGPQLNFFVNSRLVASQVDTALADGGVGVFVGGDANEAVLERFVVGVPK
jgi:LPXTG-site transpeptidase (sortase) family protein